ncbi:hypothetical protein JR316_0012338 [Psilocybe cubensis]|uniref:Uncharacterized protein n=1 Tax=Psilocybe cubensis TaxID=181762 RepID=A0ACB8GIJ4_PSICU|nr:hypothetical protein JR316_0012338 [Psilocybe cubensis]KAH9475227.1 hypothetical protein JR316_0012338 [Psilocybe cubensis]
MSGSATEETTVLADAASSPISSLCYEVLWTIFRTNADIHWNRAPMNVCRQWREIILESPSLWGMAIELDLLIHKKESLWAKEVMKRTEKSKLYISGWFNGSKPAPRTFFASLLSENWERIRRIDVGITKAKHLDPEMWGALFRPSECLEIIRIHVDEDEVPYPRMDHDGQGPIFSGTAPTLYDFSVHNIPAQCFSLSSPWLSQLRRLVISTPSAFNATDILVALGRLSALEHLVLKHVLPPVKEQLQSVSLPNLRSLNISKDFTTSSFLLKWINPGVGSTLQLNLHGYDLILHHDMFSLCKEIPRYFDNFFECAPFAKCMLLEPGYNRFKVDGWKSVDGIDSLSRRGDFSVSVSGGTAERRSQTTRPQQLIASLGACGFTHVTRFAFEPTEHLARLEDQSAFIPLLSGLRSVNHLMASPYALGALVELQETASDLFFPALTRLQFITGLWQEPTPTYHTDPVFRFIESRRESGKPISVFDVSESRYNEQYLDWTYLDKITGLKVTWSDDEGDLKEYICGTGQPEKLNLRKKWSTPWQRIEL